MEDKIVEKKVVKKPRTYSVTIKKNVIGKDRIFSVKDNPIDVTTTEKNFLKKHRAL